MGRTIMNKGKLPKSWKLLTGSTHGKKTTHNHFLEIKNDTKLIKRIIKSAVTDLALPNKITVPELQVNVFFCICFGKCLCWVIHIDH